MSASSTLIEEARRTGGVEQEVGRGRAPLSMWMAATFFIAFMTAMVFLSDGFLEADEVLHYTFGRSMLFEDWRYVLTIWGRPACTGIYGLGSLGGIIGARLVAVAVCMLTAIGTGLLAREILMRRGGARTGLRKHAVAAAWLMFFAQPMVMLYGFMVMTEMLLACSWVWTMLVLARNREKPGRGILLASVILGLGGLAGPEGWIAIACWPVFVTLWMGGPKGLGAREWKRIIAATFLGGSFVLLWYVVGAAAYSNPMWVRDGWPWAPASQYGKTLKNFVESLVGSQAGWIWIPILLGTWALRKDRQTLMLLAFPVFGLYLLHGTLGGFGLFGSMSLPRYFISIAPMAAVLAVAGLIWVEEFCSGRVLGWLAWLPRLAAPAGTVVTVWGLVSIGLLPTGMDIEQRRIHAIVAAMKERESTKEIAGRMIDTHPFLVYEMGTPSSAFGVQSTQVGKTMETAPVGTYIVTDTQLWVSEGRPAITELEAWGYEKDEEISQRADAVPKDGRVSFWLNERPNGVALYVKKR